VLSVDDIRRLADFFAHDQAAPASCVCHRRYHPPTTLMTMPPNSCSRCWRSRRPVPCCCFCPSRHEGFCPRHHGRSRLPSPVFAGPWITRLGQARGAQVRAGCSRPVRARVRWRGCPAGSIVAGNQMYACYRDGAASWSGPRADLLIEMPAIPTSGALDPLRKIIPSARRTWSISAISCRWSLSYPSAAKPMAAHRIGALWWRCW